MSKSVITNQELFDRIAIHLLLQAEKSEDYSNVCLYRSVEGNACAIGCLIKEEDYYHNNTYREIEARNINASEVQSVVSKSLDVTLSKGNIGILEELQKIHDEYSPAQWFNSLSRLAETRNLHNNVLDFASQYKLGQDSE